MYYHNGIFRIKVIPAFTPSTSLCPSKAYRVCYPQTQHDTKIKLSKNIIQYAVRTDGIMLKSTYLKK